MVEGAVVNEGPATLTQPSQSNVQCNNFNATSPSAKYLDPTTSDAEAWNRALASTNPSRPDVLLPAFIAELRDLPRMVKYGLEVGKFLNSPEFRREVLGHHRFSDWDKDPAALINVLKPTPGNLISGSKQLAIANLSIQFGMIPFLGDLAKLASFQSAVNSRRKEIDRLHSGNGLRRTVRLDERQEQITGPVIITTTGTSASANVRQSRQMRRWATVRWKPSGLNPLPPSDNEIRQMLAGVTLQSVASIAWELLPWSWLSDYFGNIGHTLSATNNFLGATARGTVMTHRQEQLQFAGGTYSSRLHISSGRRKIDWKYRTVHSGVHLPEFGIPLLGNRQLSILGSIYATRAFR